MGIKPPALKPILLTNSELRNGRTVTLDVLLHQVVEKVAAVTNHFEQAAAGMVILLMDFQMLGQVVDSLSEDRDLDFRGTGVFFVNLVICNNLDFFFFS